MFLLSESIRGHIVSRCPQAWVAGSLLAIGAAALSCSLLSWAGVPLGVAMMLGVPLAVPAFVAGFTWMLS